MSGARGEERPRPAACLNCGSTQVEEFCARCGQRNVDVRVPARDLVVDVVEDGLSLDSRVGRTVLPFLLRPGFLTVEWTRGRRARYSSPLRLYLLTSFVFFLCSGVGGDGGPTLRLGEAPDGEAVVRLREELDASDLTPEEKATVEEVVRSPQVPAGTEEQHRTLREKGWLGRAVDDRWNAYGSLPREEFLRRVNASFREWMPRIVFFLVPAAALVLAILWRRRWLSEHVVLALHLHAFAFTAFTLLLGARLVPWPAPRAVLVGALWFGLAVHVLVALRRVYGQRWRITIAKAGVAAFLYLLALSVGMLGVAGLAFWFA